MKKKRALGLGIDTGGTYTKIVVVSAQGRALHEAQVPTYPELGPRKFVERVSAALRSMDLSLFRSIRGIGLGLAGDVDSEHGSLRFTPNLRSFGGFAFRKAFEAALGLPVKVENDANMAVWGGYVVELKRRCGNVLGITMGTGIGGGLILEGRIYHGSTGSAGEIGHCCVEPEGELCHCGLRGCLEAYAGSYGIVRTARKLMAERRSLMARWCPDPHLLEPKIVAEAACARDWAARETWRVTGYYLGLGIANAVYLLNPEEILIVGGVSRAGRLILDPVASVLRAQRFKTPFKRARVRIARTPNLGAVGAGLLGLE